MATFAAISAAFRTLEHTAPGLGGRWAERLWFTVPDSGARADVTPTAPGRPLELRLQGGLLVGQHFGEGPVVYLMHGWGGRRAHLGAFVDPLVAAGFSVIAVDATSHGDSGPGEAGPGRSTILEFADLLAALSAAVGPAHAVVAHSIGCMATSVALQREELSAGRLVFIGPMADIRPYTREFARRVGFGERIRTRMVRRIEQRVSMDLAYFDVPSMADRMSAPPPPLLLIHDRQDKETRPSDSEDIAAAWPDSQLTLTSGFGHRRILSAPEVVREAVSFITTPAPSPIPSPAAPGHDVSAR
ncbi:alpha/beta hydrolase [Streptomyces sp. NPDC048484]|uniref:alpha/beta fold hydrolase n=1 Tax=Streptomyces sp. NPDC048484 TaxID=3155146 RepID=UPI003437A519